MKHNPEIITHHMPDARNHGSCLHVSGETVVRGAITYEACDGDSEVEGWGRLMKARAFQSTHARAYVLGQHF